MNRSTLLAVPLAAVALLAGGAAVGYTNLAAAQTPSSTTTTDTQGDFHHGPGGEGFRGHGPGAMGTVSAVDGNTITLTGKNGTTYTIDASSATVDKISAINVSQIQVGDTIGVQGSVSGSSITAKHIMDGVPPAQQQ